MPADRTPADPGAGRAVRVDELAPGVRVITLDRPHRLNAMSAELISDLPAPDEAGQVVVITANSPMGVWTTKEVAWSQLEVGSLQAGIDLENRTQILTSSIGLRIPAATCGHAVGSRFAGRAVPSPPRAATTCPAAVPCWVVQLPAWLSRTIRIYHPVPTFQGR
jgi:hypothetical protein